ncbi:MAG: hypothetical protein NXI32_18080, partial [bacterium]|nr:hypothetical protein [bacterium]
MSNSLERNNNKEIEVRNWERSSRGVRPIRILLVLATAFLFLVQVVLLPSPSNVAAAGLASLTFSVAAVFLIRPYRNNSGGAYTAALVILLIAANSVIPLLGMSLQAQPLTAGLEAPVTVFGHRFLFAITFLVAHFLATSTFFSRIKRYFGGLLDKGKIRECLEWDVVAVSSVVVLLLFIAKNFLGGIVGKVLDGTQFAFYFPFLLLVPPYHKKTAKRPVWLLILAAYYSVQISFGITSRMALLLAPATVFSGWTLAVV